MIISLSSTPGSSFALNRVKWQIHANTSNRDALKLSNRTHSPTHWRLIVSCISDRVHLLLLLQAKKPFQISVEICV